MKKHPIQGEILHEAYTIHTYKYNLILVYAKSNVKMCIFCVTILEIQGKYLQIKLCPPLPNNRHFFLLRPTYPECVFARKQSVRAKFSFLQETYCAAYCGSIIQLTQSRPQYQYPCQQIIFCETRKILRKFFPNKKILKISSKNSI